MTVLQNLIEEDFGIKGRGKWFHSEAHDSLVYNAEADTFYWNSEDIKGNVFTYLLKVRGMNKDQAQDFLKNSVGAFSEIKEIKSQSEPYEKLVDVFWANGINQREYWYKRCLTDDTIDRCKLGYYDGWSMIPVYDGGEFVNFQMRRDEPDKKIKQWYKSGKVFLYNESVLPFAKTIYITEGLVDSILLNSMGFPSVSALGVNTWQQDWFYKFSNIQNIYYFADNDKAGMIGASNIAKSLGLYKVKVVTFKGKENKYDVGDWFKDGGTKETFKEFIDNNCKYIFELEAPNVRTGKKNARANTTTSLSGRVW